MAKSSPATKARMSASVGSWMIRPDPSSRSITTSRQAAVLLSLYSQRRTNAPRRELLLAHPIDLALRLLPARHLQDLLEQLPPHLLDRRSFQNNPPVDVHLIDH